jgi:hypothetical protein
MPKPADLSVLGLDRATIPRRRFHCQVANADSLFGRRSSLGGAARLDGFAYELDDKPQLLFAEHGLDRAHDADLAGDLQAFADLERPLALQMAGCGHLIAAAQLVAIFDPSHRPLGTIGRRCDSGTRRISNVRSGRGGSKAGQVRAHLCRGVVVLETTL